MIAEAGGRYRALCQHPQNRYAGRLVIEATTQL